GLGEPLIGPVARAVEVGDDELTLSSAHASRLDDSPLLGPGEPGDEIELEGPAPGSSEPRAVQGEHAMLEHAKARSELNCISLPRKDRAEEAVVEGGQSPSERRRDRQRPQGRPCRDVADGEPSERPRRDLLDTEDVRVVGRRELDHLVEIGAPPGRKGVAVEEVPAADEHPFTLLPCVCSSLIRRRSHPGTTTSWPSPSRGAAPR